jgi:hypothetical protein
VTAAVSVASFIIAAAAEAVALIPLIDIHLLLALNVNVVPQALSQLAYPASIRGLWQDCQTKGSFRELFALYHSYRAYLRILKPFILN